MDSVYLDHAATTFPKSECVYQAMDKAGRTYAVNAGRGSYALARKASDVIAETRNFIKEISKVDDVAEVVLTASATLACNEIFCGLTYCKEDVVYVSPFEHNAVMRVLHGLQKKYEFQIVELALEEETGELDIPKIAYQFTRRPPRMVVMSHVSNVTGYILPIETVAELAKEQDAIVVVDGAQALGLVPMELRRMPIDFYIFAGHKTLYGPFGIGGFIHNGKRRIKPFLAGGTGSDSLNLDMSEDEPVGFEPGSPNVVAIAGLRASLMERLGNDDLEQKFHQEQELTVYLRKKLEQISGVKLYIPAHEAQQVGIVSFNIEGFQAQDVGLILDEDYQIAVRTGYQCAPLIHRYLRNESYGGVVRVSIGRTTTKEEIDTLILAVKEIAEG